METSAEARQKMGMIIAVIVTVLICCCLFAGIVLVGMAPVMDRIFASINASLMLTPNP